MAERGNPVHGRTDVGARSGQFRTPAVGPRRPGPTRTRDTAGQPRARVIDHRPELGDRKSGLARPGRGARALILSGSSLAPSGGPGPQWPPAPGPAGARPP